MMRIAGLRGTWLMLRSKLVSIANYAVKIARYFLVGNGALDADTHY